MTAVNSASGSRVNIYFLDDSSSTIQFVFSISQSGVYNLTFSVTEASSFTHLLEVTVSSFEETTSLVDIAHSSSTIPLVVDTQISSEMHIEGLSLTNQARVSAFPFLVVSDVEFALYLRLFDISLIVGKVSFTADLGKQNRGFFEYLDSSLQKWSS